MGGSSEFQRSERRREAREILKTGGCPMELELRQSTRHAGKRSQRCGNYGYEFRSRVNTSSSCEAAIAANAL